MIQDKPTRPPVRQDSVHGPACAQCGRGVAVERAWPGVSYYCGKACRDARFSAQGWAIPPDPPPG